MITASTVRMFPFDKLMLSPTNVRKAPATPAEDAELRPAFRPSASSRTSSSIRSPMPKACSPFHVRRRAPAARDDGVILSLTDDGDEAPCTLSLAWVEERVRFMDLAAVHRWARDHD
jgi:hypothetical protein